MEHASLEWRNYRYFPYEREFAKAEVKELSGTAPDEVDAGLRVPSSMFRREWAERLTYFARVVDPAGTVVVPRQTRLEASAHADDRERQATRYSAHGLHEYKGKFNPQVVRAIGNILGLDESSLVLDPFCGSGTTLLECAHAGWDAVGVDRNPLAARIANAKVRALRGADGTLQALAERVEASLSPLAEGWPGSPPERNGTVARVLGTDWMDRLPSGDYLRAWFPISVLAQVVAIQRAVYDNVKDTADRDVFNVILSNRLREASWQEPADLRIRRRKDPQDSYPLITWFLDDLRTKVDRIGRARLALGPVEGKQIAINGDIREANLASTVPHRRKFDAVITSPPYETALPYIDTQRLSLVLFGDIAASEVQNTERALIGARDIGPGERRALEEAIVQGTGLSSEIIEVCRELLDASVGTGNGFRRQARPALVYRYFKSMDAFFRKIHPVMKVGATVALVVGTNRTVLGGREFVIDTPRLLACVAAAAGFTRLRERPMETYQRYDLHQKNSINAEMLIMLGA